MKKPILSILTVILLLAVSAALLAETKPDPKALAGKINDKTYTYSDYNSILTNYFSYWSARDGKPLTADRKKDLNDQCWEEQIGVYLYDKEIKSRKLSISDQEAYNEAIKNPPQDVKKIEALKVDGKFSLDRFKEAMGKDATFKNNVQNYMKNMMRYDKLLSTIRSEAKVKPDSVKQAWFKDNNTVSGKVIVFDYTKVKGVSVADSELVAYYKANKETYKRDPARKIKYVKFTNEVSHADSVFAKTKADSLYNVLKNGADFAELAKQYSADPGSGKNGGDVGFFVRERMVKPFSDKAFALGLNEIGEPVQSQFGWHIIQTLERKTNDQGQEEVKARHILIKPEAGEQTVIKTKVDMERLQTLTKTKGIDAASGELGMKLEETAEFYEKSRSIPGLGNQPDLQKAAFVNPVGYIPEMIKGSRGEMYICQLSDSLGVHYADLEAEKAGIKTKLETDKKKSGNKILAREYLKLHQGQDYLAAAAADSLKIVEVKDAKAGAYIADIGNYAAVNDSLLTKEVGQYTGVIETENNCYVGYVTARTKAEDKKWEKEKSTALAKAKEQVQNNHLNSWYAKKRGELKIEDNRSKFYELKPKQTNSQQIKLQ